MVLTLVVQLLYRKVQYMDDRRAKAGLIHTVVSQRGDGKVVTANTRRIST